MVRPRVAGIDLQRHLRFPCTVGRISGCDRRLRQGIIRVRPDNGPRFGNGDRDSALDGAVHALILNSPQSFIRLVQSQSMLLRVRCGLLILPGETAKRQRFFYKNFTK